ncbi:MAG TPA: hypothetical protein VM582_02675 [Candidatus Thermoplasmatota archaeon]|nr:hypothetical protein [Candidatus Thermoplasmatota archaeon]
MRILLALLTVSLVTFVVVPGAAAAPQPCEPGEPGVGFGRADVVVQSLSVQLLPATVGVPGASTPSTRAVVATPHVDQRVPAVHAPGTPAVWVPGVALSPARVHVGSFLVETPHVSRDSAEVVPARPSTVLAPEHRIIVPSEVVDTGATIPGVVVPPRNVSVDETAAVRTPIIVLLDVPTACAATPAGTLDTSDPPALLP